MKNIAYDGTSNAVGYENLSDNKTPAYDSGIGKKLQFTGEKTSSLLGTRPAAFDSVFIKDRDHYRKIYFKNIQWLEAAGSYTYIHIAGKQKICVSFTLNELAKRIPDEIFIRTHRSFIINLHHIESLIGNMLCIGTEKIPISKTYRTDIINSLNILGRNLL